MYPDTIILLADTMAKRRPLECRSTSLLVHEARGYWRSYVDSDDYHVGLPLGTCNHYTHHMTENQWG